MMLRKALYYVTHWEAWHWFAKYIIIGPAWLWYCLKSRSLWFYTASNPEITFGGYVGETKEEVYKLLPPGSYPKSIFVTPSWSVTELVRMMDTKGLAFPIAAKAASGIMGFMFRKIESVEQLKKYHAYMPVDYILQEFIAYPLEVSVFYYRYPDALRGNITGFVRKELPEVIGDGEHTIWELICAHPRLQFKLEEMKSKHALRLHDILPVGEKYPLSLALNLSRGGKLVSLAHLKDDQLLAIFDSLSHYSGQLFFGRYDIRCRSIEDLKEGKNFKILEFNGCGGEPHHVYGDGNSLWKACKILLDHWKILYEISKMNRQKGYVIWPHKTAWNFFQNSIRHIIRLKKLDQKFSFEQVPAFGKAQAILDPVQSYS